MIFLHLENGGNSDPPPQLDFSPKKLKDPTAQNSFLLCSNSKVAFRMTKDKKYQNRRFFAFGKNDFDFATYCNTCTGYNHQRKGQ